MLNFLASDGVRSVLDIGLGGIALMLYARQGKILAGLVRGLAGHERRLKKLEKSGGR